jgi:protein phosphatase 2C family protein 2/3
VPVLTNTLWLVVKLWALCLAAFFCRSRVGLWAASIGQILASGVPAREPSRRRTAKTTRTASGSWFSLVSCEMQGWRDAMEDAVVCVPSLSGNLETSSLFAVFDGHGGAEVSAFAAERITKRVTTHLASEVSPEDSLRRALLDIEEELRALNTPAPGMVTAQRYRGQTETCRYDYVGCTAAVALLTSTSVSVIGVGDSRIFKCRNGECVPLTRDHKPESPRERRRIEAAGGTVIKFGPCYRVDCSLNLSRSLADFAYKDPRLPPKDQKISPVGDAATFDIDQEDEFLVLACDGLFELMTWKTVCAYIRERIQDMPLTQIAEGLLDQCCSPNIMATCGRGTDNESVVIVKLHDPAKSPKDTPSK